MHLSIIAAVTLMTVSAGASAQSGDSIDLAIHRIFASVQHVSQTTKNLVQMRNSLSRDQSNAVDEVVGAWSEFHGALGEATATGLIAEQMSCPDDIRFTRKMFSEAARNAVETADVDIQRINIELPQITAYAVVAEITKIRDGIIELRAALKPFSGK
jgi:hypothetical protein